MARRKKIDCGGPRAHYCRERQFSPKKCVKGTIRTIRSGSARIVVCRVKGLRSKSRAQSILRPHSNPKCAACRVR
jgi:hypothetical protein